jgi:molecular chaperone GrpE (heat shock protein)
MQTRAVEDAATRLGPAAAALERAANHSEAATAPLPELTRELSGMHLALQRATEAQATTQLRAAELAQNLSEAIHRFEGLDRQLGGVFTALEGGLLRIQQQVVRFASEVDTATERAVRALSGAIDNLQDVLEAVTPAGRR